MVFVKLQSKDLLVSQQKTVLENLAIALCSQLRVDDPYTMEEMNALNINTTSKYGR